MRSAEIRARSRTDILVCPGCSKRDKQGCLSYTFGARGETRTREYRICNPAPWPLGDARSRTDILVCPDCDEIRDRQECRSYCWSGRRDSNSRSEFGRLACFQLHHSRWFGVRRQCARRRFGFRVRTTCVLRIDPKRVALTLTGALQSWNSWQGSNPQPRRSKRRTLPVELQEPIDCGIRIADCGFEARKI
ncbi:MAG: hypothetical protein QOE77_1399 [Blastocatellia bacterium]|nr:hypothetical protein [Blastocatellia bacterium]